jgi:hypothetical protein
VTQTLETQSETERLESVISSKSGRKSVFAFAVFALGLNATAAVYTMSPSDFALPNVGALAELLPHEKASVSLPDPVVTALKDIQSAQQQHAAALLESSSSLQQNAALLQHDSLALVSLRQSLSDEQSDIKKISSQLSALMNKVDTLQNAIAPEITSSISKGRVRARLSILARKRIARQQKPVGPISVGGAPLTTAPAQASGTLQSPEG